MRAKLLLRDTLIIIMSKKDLENLTLENYENEFVFRENRFKIHV